VKELAIRAMTYADIAPLAKNLRQADIDEIRYSTGLPAETQLRILFQLPTKKDYTILGEDNLVLGGFGVTPSPMFTGVGIPWIEVAPIGWTVWQRS